MDPVPCYASIESLSSANAADMMLSNIKPLLCTNASPDGRGGEDTWDLGYCPLPRWYKEIELI